MRAGVGLTGVRLDLGEPDGDRSGRAEVRTVAPSRSGATSSTGGRRTRAGGGQRSPVAQAACACAASARAASCSATRAGAVPPWVERARSAPRTESTDRTSGVSRGSTDGQGVVVDLPQLQAVLVAVPDQPAGDLVRVPERGAAAHQPLGHVGGQRVPGGRFNPTDRGQMDVYESHSRLESDCVTYGIFTMPCICNDRKVWISLQYLTQELSHNRMVINDENINHKCSRLGNLDGRVLSLRRGMNSRNCRKPCGLVLQRTEEEWIPNPANGAVHWRNRWLV